MESVEELFMRLGPYGIISAIPPLGWTTTIERIVYAINGELVPQLQQAIDLQAVPVLPKVSDILHGCHPEITEMLRAIHNPCLRYKDEEIPEHLFLTVLGIDSTGKTQECQIRDKQTASMLLNMPFTPPLAIYDQPEQLGHAD